jgi:hypothetical protein
LGWAVVVFWFVKLKNRFAVPDPVDDYYFRFFGWGAAAEPGINCTQPAALALHHRQPLEIEKACMIPLVFHGLIQKEQQPVAGYHRFTAGAGQIVTQPIFVAALQGVKFLSGHA